MKVAVIGWGHYGQALGSLLAQNKVDFTPVDISLPLKHKVDVLFQVVPTQSIRTAFETNAKFIKPNTLIVNAAKGIEQKTHLLPHQIIQELGYSNYCSLMGPSFASGIVERDPTIVSLGYTDKTQIKVVKDLLCTPYFRIQPTADYQSLEVASALKNVYAILCGYADGLHLGANTRAKLITLGLQEIVKLGEAMAMSVDILAPGIVGDLVLTCSSSESRNFKFGKHLAAMSQAEALAKADSTVEGFHTSQSVKTLAKKHGVKLPAAELTQTLIDGGVSSRPHFYKFVASL